MPFQLLRSAQFAGRRVTSAPITRTFAQTRFASSTKSATNPSNTGPSSGANQDAADINSSRATDSRTGSPDTASVQNPVSNRGQSGAAQSEEPQQSWENVRRDPSEPDDVKRAHVDQEGKKPLDPADKPVAGGSK
ncbi:hypothetical protein Q7P37_003096 [Cladosporium fusiforme]